jgi:hypothetical protein
MEPLIWEMLLSKERMVNNLFALPIKQLTKTHTRVSENAMCDIIVDVS